MSEKNDAIVELEDTIVVLGSLVPVAFLLGGTIVIIVLLTFPSIFWRMSQRCKMENVCCKRRRREPSPEDDPTYNPGDNTVTAEAGHVVNHNYDYSEIDMKNVQTLPLQNTKVKGPGSYEDYLIDNDLEHQYRSCGNEHEENKPAHVDRISGNLTYVILEPGSNNRLPVKMITGTVQKQLEDDTERIYFKLEPGTNKVTPQIDMSEANWDHTYFVLEKLESNFDDINAYAINDITDHTYFLLEKE